MQDIARRWTIETQRGPDWLFIRLHEPEGFQCEDNDLAEQLWSLLEQHFLHRLVLEMDDLTALRSALIGQLVRLHKRIHRRGGLMRICGLSENCREALRACRMDNQLPHYRDREEAVMGYRPTLPR